MLDSLKSQKERLLSHLERIEKFLEDESFTDSFSNEDRQYYLEVPRVLRVLIEDSTNSLQLLTMAPYVLEVLSQVMYKFNPGASRTEETTRQLSVSHLMREYLVGISELHYKEHKDKT